MFKLFSKTITQENLFCLKKNFNFLLFAFFLQKNLLYLTLLYLYKFHS